MPKLEKDFSSLFLNQQKKRGACVLSSSHPTFIDHAIPIASILDIPMITNDLSFSFTYKHFYPPFKCLLKNWTIASIIKEYSTLFYGFSPETYFNQTIENEKKKNPENDVWHLPVKFIYHFHGCSDKCWFQKNSHLTDVNQILFYGNRMKDLFKDLHLLDKIKSYSFIGNYRKVYYQKHQTFFDQLAEKEIFSQFEKKQFTLLYAPTWMEHINPSSIFKSVSSILDNLPDRYNLLIKLHPNLNRKMKGYCPKKLYELLDPYTQRFNVQIIPFFPCIYPILNQVDAYLGDYSSVGYDALSFDIPLFFINDKKKSPANDKEAYLYQAGVPIELEEIENLYFIIEKALSEESSKNSIKRKEVYEYGFGKDLSYNETKKRLEDQLLI